MASQIGLVQLPAATTTSSPGRSTGSDRSSRASTSEKIAVLAPMPSPIESSAAITRPGLLRSERTP
jgi:hypothetical protein